MSPQRIVGIIMLIGGIAVMIVGVNSSHSVSDQLSNTFRGRFTDSTNWYIIGGGVVAAVGLVLSLFGMRGRNA
jgi:hypothetical protein